MMNFWKELPRPILVQAPMEDVSDTVFRQMLGRCAAPDVYFTEFTNVDGVFSEGGERVAHRLKFSKKEHPIVAQIWGHKPENYFNGAKYVREKGFDGVDLNMGCPQKDVVKKGLCSGLIENRGLAEQVIKATLEGAGDMPVSIKTRIGMRQPITEDWIGFLLGFDVAAITVHGRTVKEMSKVPAHWDEIALAVKLRDRLKKETLILGNGDVKNRSEALHRVTETGVDGVMIGRGMLENIYAFHEDPHFGDSVSQAEKFALLKFHIRLFQKTWGSGAEDFHKKEYTMRKFFKLYVRDFDGASALREELMKVTLDEAVKRIERCIE